LDVKAKCIDLAPEMVDRLKQIALSDYDSMGPSVKAAEIIIAYAEGKPTERLEVTKIERPHADLTDAELDARIRELEAGEAPTTH
jgi:hypothetical protein